MLTMTIDGHAVELSAEDAAFLADSLRAALVHRGPGFTRTHTGVAGAFRLTSQARRRNLRRGVHAFRADDVAGSVKTDC